MCVYVCRFTFLHLVILYFLHIISLYYFFVTSSSSFLFLVGVTVPGTIQELLPNANWPEFLSLKHRYFKDICHCFIQKVQFSLHISVLILILPWSLVPSAFSWDVMLSYIHTVFFTYLIVTEINLLLSMHKED